MCVPVLNYIFKSDLYSNSKVGYYQSNWRSKSRADSGTEFPSHSNTNILENNVIFSPAKKQRTLVFLDLKSHCRRLFLRQQNTAFFPNHVGLSPLTSLATTDLNWPERQLRN